MGSGCSRIQGDDDTAPRIEGSEVSGPEQKGRGCWSPWDVELGVHGSLLGSAGAVPPTLLHQECSDVTADIQQPRWIMRHIAQ